MQAENCSFEITPVPNSIFYKSICFKNSSNQKIFNHLEPSCFAFPLRNLTQHLPAIDKISLWLKVLKMPLFFLPLGFLTQTLHCAYPTTSPRYSRHGTVFRSVHSLLLWGIFPTGKPVRAQPSKACIDLFHPLFFDQSPNPLNPLQ